MSASKNTKKKGQKKQPEPQVESETTENEFSEAEKKRDPTDSVTFRVPRLLFIAI
jgi:hypothetical protein